MTFNHSPYSGSEDQNLEQNLNVENRNKVFIIDKVDSEFVISQNDDKINLLNGDDSFVDDQGNAVSINKNTKIAKYDDKTLEETSTKVENGPVGYKQNSSLLIQKGNSFYVKDKGNGETIHLKKSLEDQNDLKVNFAAFNESGIVVAGWFEQTIDGVIQKKVLINDVEYTVTSNREINLGDSRYKIRRDDKMLYTQKNHNPSIIKFNIINSEPKRLVEDSSIPLENSNRELINGSIKTSPDDHIFGSNESTIWSFNEENLLINGKSYSLGSYKGKIKGVSISSNGEHIIVKFNEIDGNGFKYSLLIGDSSGINKKIDIPHNYYFINDSISNNGLIAYIRRGINDGNVDLIFEGIEQPLENFTSDGKLEIFEFVRESDKLHYKYDGTLHKYDEVISLNPNADEIIQLSQKKELDRKNNNDKLEFLERNNIGSVGQLESIFKDASDLPNIQRLYDQERESRLEKELLLDDIKERSTRKNELLQANEILKKRVLEMLNETLEGIKAPKLYGSSTVSSESIMKLKEAISELGKL